MADKLVKQAIDKIGLDETQAKQALGALLSFCKNQAGDFDFDGMMKKIPGMTEVFEDAKASRDVPTDGGNGGSIQYTVIGILTYFFKTFGLLDILKNLLAPFLGENGVRMLEGGADSLELAGILEKLGVSKEQGTKLVKMLVDFVKKHVGGDTVDNLVKSVPVLQTIMAEEKKEE